MGEKMIQTTMPYNLVVSHGVSNSHSLEEPASDWDIPLAPD
jgi:hypothetical protein